MNKFVIAALLTLSVTGIAEAKTKRTTTPVPPTRPTEFNTTDPTMYGAVVKDGQIVVKAPVGSNVQVDVDGGQVDISTDTGDRGLLGLGVLGL